MADMEVTKKVYSADEIQVILGIGRSKVYEFLDSVNKKQEPFRVIKIGRIYRVPKDSFDRWMNGETRGGLTSEHCKTAKKWKQYCAGRLASNLSNSKGTDANKIFIAKAAYGMAETKAVEQEQITGVTKTVKQIAKEIGADELPDFGDQEDDTDAFDF